MTEKEEQAPASARIGLQMVIDPQGGPISITTDAEVGNAVLRTIARSFVERLNDSFTTVLTKATTEATDHFSSGHASDAAKTLLNVSPLLARLPIKDVQLLAALANSDNVDIDSRIRLWAAAVSVYEGHREWGLAREVASLAHDVAVQHERPEAAAWALMAKGNSYAHEGQYLLAKAVYAEVIRDARQGALEQTLAWGYHNLGSVFWEEGDRASAFLEWERELKVRESQDRLQVARAMGFVADRYEQFDRTRAAALYNRLLDLLQGGAPLNPAESEIRAEVAYRLAVLFLGKEAWDDALRYAELSLTGYLPLVNREYRLASCHQLIALACEGLGKSDIAAFHLAEKQRLIEQWGRDHDRFRDLLAPALSQGDETQQRTALLQAEKVSHTLGEEAQIEWRIVAALAEVQAGHEEKALEHLQQGLLLESRVTSWEDKRAQASLHFTAAHILFGYNKLDEALPHAAKAFSLDASDVQSGVLLAKLQLNLGHVAEIEETLQALERLEQAGQLNATLVRALLAVKRGDFAGAARLFDQGYQATQGKNWGACRDECLDLNACVLDPAEAPLLGPLWQQGQQQQVIATATVIPLLSRRAFLPDTEFYAKVLLLCADWILRNQDTAPPFVRTYLEGKNAGKSPGLKEEDFRNLFQLVASTHFPEVRGEESRTFGRSDLLIPNNDDLRRRVRFEFKVWGRNDYTDVVDQLIKYMTDQEEIGIVYMVNPNKSDIAQSYRQVAILDRASYFGGSYREGPVRPDVQGLPHFSSTHLTQRGRPVTIYHFIHNVWA